MSLVREEGGEQLFVRKVLEGRHDIYTTLQSFPHPCIPKLYEVSISDDTTEIIEEYVEGQPLSNAGGGYCTNRCGEPSGSFVLW